MATELRKWTGRNVMEFFIWQASNLQNYASICSPQMLTLKWRPLRTESPSWDVAIETGSTARMQILHDLQAKSALKWTLNLESLNQESLLRLENLLSHGPNKYKLVPMVDLSCRRRSKSQCHTGILLIIFAAEKKK